MLILQSLVNVWSDQGNKTGTKMMNKLEHNVKEVERMLESYTVSMLLKDIDETDRKRAV